MRTTLVIEDNLYRRVKAKAAMEGRTVTELVECGLRFVLDAPTATKRAESKPEWIRIIENIPRDSRWEEEMKKVDAAIEEAFEQIEVEEVMSPEEASRQCPP